MKTKAVIISQGTNLPRKIGYVFGKDGSPKSCLSCGSLKIIRPYRGRQERKIKCAAGKLNTYYAYPVVSAAVMRELCLMAAYCKTRGKR